MLAVSFDTDCAAAKSCLFNSFLGLMPTAQVAAVEVIDKAQEHHSNSEYLN